MKMHPLYLIFVVGVILKLTGIISWSWWIITLPLWIIPAIFGIILFLVTFIAYIDIILKL